MLTHLPRLHRRGLVEASGVERQVRPPDGPFRAFTGAASLKHSYVRGPGRVALSFRAFTGAASLKPSGAIDDIGVSARPFRAFTGAASLKRAGRVFLLPVEHVLPRLHRRGLVEACFIRSQSALARRAFRAFTGAASLKQGSREGLRLEVTEAFRAFTGAASLKPAVLALRGRFFPAFRAFTGAASLKPVQPSRRGLRPGLPRLHRRGLVEAVGLRPTPWCGTRPSAPSPARPR